MPRNMNLRYPFEVGLVGDAAETLRALVPLLESKADRRVARKIEKSVRDWYAEVERRAKVEAPPVNPKLVVWELSKRLPDDVMIAGDSGSSAVWIGRDLKFASRDEIVALRVARDDGLGGAICAGGEDGVP